MNNNILKLKIEDFRAIQNANIDLDGITVVAGLNGCGKSTLSRLMYDSMKIALNYDEYVIRNINRDFTDVFRTLHECLREMERSSSDTQERIKNDNRWLNPNSFRQLFLNINEDSDEYARRIFSIIETLQDFLLKSVSKKIGLFNDSFIDEPLNTRINKILKLINSVNNDRTDEVRRNIDDINESFAKLRRRIEHIIYELQKTIENRPADLFFDELSSAFTQDMHSINFDIFEFDIPLIDKQNNILNVPNVIQNCIYINTPWAIDVDFAEHDCWEDLKELLQESKALYINNPNVGLLINQISGNDVISGHVTADNDLFQNNFIYKRNDGATFGLGDCATGIKSFGILQMLLQNGCLDKNTLLIIDEPEAHLHPQWIAEYARLIVLLNKLIGVRCFIASHNPDMINAIRYISEKEEVLEKTKFYLASKGDSYKYDYISLGDNIDPIYESFNLAYDRIRKYSE